MNEHFERNGTFESDNWLVYKHSHTMSARASKAGRQGAKGTRRHTHVHDTNDKDQPRLRLCNARAACDQLARS